MVLIAPDILEEARGISLAVSGLVALMGLMLFALGWRWHRFWIGMSITISGGLIGLYSGRALGGNILALGVLLAISAGVLALELARILAFFAGGMATWLIATAILPQANELWVAFLIGGLAGVLMYRLWTMFLTSLIGLIVAIHALMILAENVFSWDMVRWTESHQILLSIVVIGLTFVGVLFQSSLESWTEKIEARRKKEKEEEIRKNERKKVLAEIPPKVEPPSFWSRFFHIGHAKTK